MPLSIHNRIAAILPCYGPQGDGCQILSVDGCSHIVTSRVPTVLRRLARSRAIDLQELRRRSGGITCRRLLQPLPLAPGLTLVPLKVRQPRVAGDPAIGYVNLCSVIAVNKPAARPGQSLIELRGGGQITCLWNSGTVQRLLSLARLTNTESGNRLRESSAEYGLAIDALQPLARRLAEVFYDILILKQRSDSLTAAESGRGHPQ